MLTKIERLGDRLLSLVVPHANASAECTCTYVGDCDISRLRWFCCRYTPAGQSCYYECNYRNPC
ncbi:hypothetical protein [Actinomadura madurae]|uniref:hypothetical protein n=1 Tax=Actinomadura madurae TaxID=1993 RepID=UPI0020262B03|nr:hypothetical protein [Actinomadura madurae]MCP9949598.1 hypothetical protein [Actinomadura madurae]MCP9966353.1 hypothetical protein [Actinomadura madurae]MCP9978843.1 hypothetical protein [Actinomadura madurae]MCQ0009629.1 hypothetical protein [Actinomadura madurae]MCQ0015030.1 hypothetical protein [Actinomadura madurae]